MDCVWRRVAVGGSQSCSVPAEDLGVTVQVRGGAGRARSRERALCAAAGPRGGRGISVLSAFRHV